MKEVEGTRLNSYKDAPWAKAPKTYQNIVHEDDNIIVYKDGFPVTEGHLLFVPKRTVLDQYDINFGLDIMRCFEMAYRQGTEGVENGEWDAFNVGINNGIAAGQSVMWPHVHLIPRRKGDNPNPRGGVRNVIPLKGNYNDDDTTEDGWENEGGMALPEVDDNTPREELDEATRMPMQAPFVLVEDNWKERYKGYKEKFVQPAPCSRTALIRDRAIDEIKTEMKGKRLGRSWEKVDDDVWDKVVQRMKNKERKKKE